jgi:hypothetical protein
MPDDTVVPVLTALALSLIGAFALMHCWLLCDISIIAIVACIVTWLWPRRELGQTATSFN